MHKPTFWFYVGFYGLIYLFLIAFIVVGFPMAHEYARPLAKVLFPEYTNASLFRTIIITSLMYWGMVAASVWWSRRQARSE